MVKNNEQEILYEAQFSYFSEHNELSKKVQFKSTKMIRSNAKMTSKATKSRLFVAFVVYYYYC